MIRGILYEIIVIEIIVEGIGLEGRGGEGFFIFLFGKSSYC